LLSTDGLAVRSASAMWRTLHVHDSASGHTVKQEKSMRLALGTIVVAAAQAKIARLSKH